MDTLCRSEKQTFGKWNLKWFSLYSDQIKVKLFKNTLFCSEVWRYFRWTEATHLSDHVILVIYGQNTIKIAKEWKMLYRKIAVLWASKKVCPQLKTSVLSVFCIHCLYNLHVSRQVYFLSSSFWDLCW